ncbi:hypothetical protein CMI42_03470 [Candidatus Pacearchaeota archaeon]|nr:hypothetical protein [Candidatus Pacearchaeota archaeon]|tara:strand:- start:425 stop:886 length:462 start_codon:yes stop_codon:yes gene_type:complete
MILENLDDVVRILDTSCLSCLDYRGVQENLIDVKRQDNAAVFSCKWGDSYQALTTDFCTTREDFDRLQQEFLDLGGKFKKRDSVPYDMAEFSSENQALLKMLGIFGEFASEDLKVSLDGYCKYCSSESGLTIVNRKLYISCTSCADVIASSLD